MYVDFKIYDYYGKEFMEKNNIKYNEFSFIFELVVINILFYRLLWE